MTVLFICSGNIHRSALAEAMLRAAIERDGRGDLEVLSAGTIAIAGCEAAREAAELADEEGLDLSAHRSQPVSGALVDRADMIVVMERYHLDWIAETHPGARDRCRLLSEHAGPEAGLAPGEDVPDAIGCDLDSFRRSYRIIRDCVSRLYRELPPAPREVYARSIEDRFRQRRRSPLTLSPADYDLLDRWWDRGIPLWIVLEGIDDLFRRKESEGDGSRVRRLAYCAQEIEERFEAYQRSVGAATAPAPKAAPREGGELRAAAAARLREAAREARLRGLPQAAEIFERVAAEASDEPPRAEDTAATLLRLHELEESMMGMLRQAAGGERLESLHREAAERLAGYRDRMTEAAFTATVARLVAEELRDHFGVPSLTGPPPRVDGRPGGR